MVRGCKVVSKGRDRFTQPLRVFVGVDGCVMVKVNPPFSDAITRSGENGWDLFRAWCRERSRISDAEKARIAKGQDELERKLTTGLTALLKQQLRERENS